VRPRSRPGPVAVRLLADDQQATAPLAEQLRACPAIRLLPMDQPGRTDVILVLASAVTDRLLAEMDGLARRTASSPCLVLVADPPEADHLAALIGCGVVSILPRRGVSATLIAQAVLASHAGRAILPATVARWLVDGARLARPGPGAVSAPRPGGLTDRETEVLRLLAEGLDTAQIAARLRYSERTIKKILQDITTRLQLRNRTHAVSYALRAGAI
jgi:DNA-binding NarL/FixJ family response regulator